MVTSYSLPTSPASLPLPSPCPLHTCSLAVPRPHPKEDSGTRCHGVSPTGPVTREVEVGS